MKLGYFASFILTSKILWLATAQVSSCQNGACCLTCCTATQLRPRWNVSEKWCKRGCGTETCDELLSLGDFQSCSIGLSFRNGDVVSLKMTETSCCANTGVLLTSEKCERLDKSSISFHVLVSSSVSAFGEVVGKMQLFFRSVIALVVLVIIETMFFKYLGNFCPWSFPPCFYDSCGLSAMQCWASWRCLAYWLPDIWFWPAFYIISFVVLPVLIAVALVLFAALATLCLPLFSAKKTMHG